MKSGISAALLALALGACAEDKFVERRARLDVTAVTDGYTYQVVDNDSRTIHLGEVPVYTSKTAAFRLSNPTTSNLLIDTIEVIESAGEKWIVRDIDGVCEVDACGESCDICRATRDGKLPLELMPGGSAVLEVEYAPLAVGN